MNLIFDFDCFLLKHVMFLFSFSALIFCFCVCYIYLVDEVHEKEHVVGEVVFLLAVDLEPMGRLLVKVLFTKSTNEALILKQQVIITV